MKEKNEVKGLGGWLAVWILILIIMLLVSIYPTYLLIILKGPIIYIFLSISSFLLTLFTVYLLFKKDKYAPSWVIMLIWLGAFEALLFYDSPLKLIPTALLYAFVAFLLTSYWKLSVRVENTFIH